MANAYKYGFNPDAIIEKLFQKSLVGDGDNGFLQTLIDNAIEENANPMFWQEHFTLDGTEYKVNLANSKLDPAYTVNSVVRNAVPMADAMAPLSEVAQIDGEGYETRTGSIHQFGKGMYETSLSKEELKARLETLDIKDANLLNGFVRNVADIIRGHNYRLSYMAAQVLSLGGAYNNTSSKGWSGVKVDEKAYIPATNFVKAGAKVWSEAECDIPSQMQKIEEDFKKSRGLSDDFTFEWDIPYDLVVGTLLNNKYFKAEVNRYIRLYAPDKVIVVTNGANSVDNSIISWEQLVAYSRSSISKIAPIRVCKQESIDQTITTINTVKGWKTGVAVLRPLGYAGVVVHSDVAEVPLLQREANNTIDYQIAKTQGFLYVINKVVPNGIYKAYHTDVIGRYAPVLTEWNNHLVVDTTQANG